MNYILYYSGEIPKYFKYSIESILNVENNECKIFFCGDKTLNQPNVINLNENDFSSDLINEIKLLNYFESEKNPLWQSSLLRIFYILECAKANNINSFVHFDADVLIYQPFNKIKHYFKDSKLNITPVNELFLNFSYSYINNLDVLEKICNKIFEILKNYKYYENTYYQGNRLNEMIMLNIVYILNPHLFNLLEILPKKEGNFIFDPGSYGQYLGGIHNKYFSKKYINEEHYVGRNILRNNYKIKFENHRPYVYSSDIKYSLINLHVHSKKLHKFI